MRRIITTLFIAALGLSVAPALPAQAHDALEPTTRVTISQPGTGPHAGEVVVQADIHEDELLHRIKGYKIELVGKGAFCDYAFPTDAMPGTDLTVAFTWKTKVAPGGGVRCDEYNPEAEQQQETASPVLPASGSALQNGTYALKVTATLLRLDGDDAHTITAQSTVKVQNAVGAPSGVSLAHDAKAGKTTVSWSDINDVNVAGFRVQRCLVDRSSKPCDDWNHVDDVAGTSVSVPTTDIGVHRFRVATIWIDSSGNGALTTYSGPQGDPTEIEVKPTPGTTSSSTTSTTQPKPEEPRPVVLPRRVQRSAPQVVQKVVEAPDYETELPYEESSASGDEEAISGLPLAGEEGDGDQRALLVPMAGALLLLMFSGQLWYLNKRAGAAALEPVSLDEID